MDYVLKCTPEELRTAFGSKFWKDIEGSIEDAVEVGKEMVLDPALNEESVEMNIVRGMVKGLRKVLEFPESLLSELKMQSEVREMEEQSEYEDEN